MFSVHGSLFIVATCVMTQVFGQGNIDTSDCQFMYVQAAGMPEISILWSRGIHYLLFHDD